MILGHPFMFAVVKCRSKGWFQTEMFSSEHLAYCDCPFWPPASSDHVFPQSIDHLHVIEDPAKSLPFRISPMKWTSGIFEATVRNRLLRWRESDDKFGDSEDNNNLDEFLDGSSYFSSHNLSSIERCRCCVSSGNRIPSNPLSTLLCGVFLCVLDKEAKPLPGYSDNVLDSVMDDDSWSMIESALSFRIDLSSNVKEILYKDKVRGVAYFEL